MTREAQHSSTAATGGNAGPGLPAETADGRARAAALAAGAFPGRSATSLVSYESRGSLLVIGPEPYAREQARALADRLDCSVLATDADVEELPLVDRPPASPSTDVDSERMAVRVARAKLVGITGHLGEFVVTVSAGGQELNLARSLGRGRDHFDLVLDLCRAPHIRYDVLPFGYYAPGRDAEALYRALEEIPAMVGEFEKPTFFSYDPDICAHGRSGLRGCTRCLDACPTGAISSIGELVNVDPYLCQGGGSCATACPSGAITYAYPRVSDLLGWLRQLLKAYREAGGRRAQILFHDGEGGREWLARMTPSLPERVIPVELEEIGSAGMDAWLALLAYGAEEVTLLVLRATPVSVREELEQQVCYARAVLEGMGYDGARLRLVEAETDEAALSALTALPEQPPVPPAGFAGQDEKRTTLRLALDHLYAHAPAPVRAAPLPEGAPFGEVRFDHEACTLCMACVSVCPAAALEAGGEEPALHFIEWNCVQCGLCEAACPEDAIAPSPRMLYDPEARFERRTLKEEAPFRCVACGKPFATQSLMARMREKLSGHWMFQTSEALRRLEMCEDCRVKDVFAREGGLNPYDKR